MTRLLCVAVLVACVAMGFALDASATASMSTTSSASPSPSPSPTSKPATSSSAPTGSPVPPLPVEQHYFLNNATGKACLRMDGLMNMTFRFVNGSRMVNKTKMEPTYETLLVPVKAKINEMESSCNNSNTKDYNKALLVLEWNDDVSPYYLEFHFVEDVSKKNWSMDYMRFMFSVDDNPAFKDYIYRQDYTEIFAKNSTPVFDGVDLNYSFRCNAQQNYSFAVSNGTESTDSIKTLMVNLTTMDWRVQAFSFKKNVTGGQYDNAKLCDADAESRSKIVPIAVGCALAGLVIIVLVAYLIGRFRSRKHESYETLS